MFWSTTLVDLTLEELLYKSAQANMNYNLNTRHSPGIKWDFGTILSNMHHKMFGGKKIFIYFDKDALKCKHLLYIEKNGGYKVHILYQYW